MRRYFQKIDGGDYISLWKSKGLPDESINPTTTPKNSIAPRLSYFGNETKIKFDGSCLKLDKINLHLLRKKQ